MNKIKIITSTLSIMLFASSIPVLSGSIKPKVPRALSNILPQKFKSRRDFWEKKVMVSTARTCKEAKEKSKRKSTQHKQAKKKPKRPQQIKPKRLKRDGRIRAQRPEIAEDVHTQQTKVQKNQWFNDLHVDPLDKIVIGGAATIAGIIGLRFFLKFLPTIKKVGIFGAQVGILGAIASASYLGIKKLVKPKPANKSWGQEIQGDCSKIFNWTKSMLQDKPKPAANKTKTNHKTPKTSTKKNKYR